MKWLFMLLVALNLAFFIWQVNHEQNAFIAPQQADTADGSKRLVLLRELDAELAKMPPPAAENPAPENASPPLNNAPSSAPNTSATTQ